MTSICALDTFYDKTASIMIVLNKTRIIVFIMLITRRIHAAPQSQNAVTAYLKRDQLLHFYGSLLV